MTEERRNFYRILHVQPEAPLEVIRASYRTLMSTMRAHPDLGGDAQVAARINAAYAVLTDPERRKAYDRALKRPWVGPAAVTAAATAPIRPVAESVTSLDAATWQADRACPFCRRPMPAVIHTDTRCAACNSPLFRRPNMDNGELFGRRGSPRNARAMAATLRLPARPGDHAARLRDLSLSGLCVLSPVPAAPRSAMRVLTAGFDTVAVVVSCRANSDGYQLHGELLTLQLLRSQGVFVSEKA